MRRSFIIAIALLLASIAVWAALWLLTWQTAQRQLAAFAARAGSDFQYRLIDRAGTPWSVEMELADVRLQLASGLRLTAPRLIFSLTPGRWWHYRVHSDGQAELAFHGPAQTRFQLASQVLEAKLTLYKNGRWREFHANLTQASLKHTPQNAIAPRPWLTSATAQLFLQQPETPPADHLQTGHSIAFAMTEASLQPGLLRALPQQIKALVFNARLLGPPPDFRDPAAIDAWRDHGGTLEIDALECDWGRLTARLKATLALDKARQPEGAGTAQLLLHSANPAPPDAPDFNRFMDTLFALMARPDPHSGAQTVTVPVALQARRLTLGIFPLTTLPELRWNE